MPMSPYILVLAQTSHEGAKYVRRAGLPRGRWRVVAKASSIRGIRRAHVHCLPGFHVRPDKHAILGVLRYAECEWFDVEMPLTEAEIAELDAIPWTIDERTLEVAYRYNRLRDALNNEIDALVDLENEADDPRMTEAVVDKIEFNQDSVEMLEGTPKQKRRRKCSDCGTLHFKDEDCARTDGVEETPVATPATMFD